MHVYVCICMYVCMSVCVRVCVCVCLCMYVWYAHAYVYMYMCGSQRITSIVITQVTFTFTFGEKKNLSLVWNLPNIHQIPGICLPGLEIQARNTTFSGLRKYRKQNKKQIKNQTFWKFKLGLHAYKQTFYPVSYLPGLLFLFFSFVCIWNYNLNIIFFPHVPPSDPSYT